MDLLGMSSMSELQRVRTAWIEDAQRAGVQARYSSWSDSIAVGSNDFLKEIKAKLGYRAGHRNITREGDICALRDEFPRYRIDFGLENAPLSADAGRVDG